MFNDWFNLKVGWILSMRMPVVPRRFDIDYPAVLQKIRGAAKEVFQLVYSIWI